MCWRETRDEDCEPRVGVLEMVSPGDWCSEGGLGRRLTWEVVCVEVVLESRKSPAPQGVRGKQVRPGTDPVGMATFKGW